jgi:endo-1,4-beta-xylanase
MKIKYRPVMCRLLIVLLWSVSPIAPMAAMAAMPWDTASLDAAIRQHRMGQQRLRVVNPQGTPLPGVTIAIKQVRHAFGFGIALSTEAFSGKIAAADQQRYQQLAKSLFNRAVPENAMKWTSIEPLPGQVSYATLDQIVLWSKQAHLPLRGHTLFWDVEQFNQDWLKSLSPAQLRQAMLDRTAQLCRRYRGQIDEIDLFNEMLHGDFLRSRLGASIVKEVADTCQQANPLVKLDVNDYDILTGQKLDAYVQQIQALLDDGVVLGGIGIQAHLTEKLTTQQIHTALDRLAVFRLPIKITEVSIKAPTEAAQAEWLVDFYRAAFAHPAVETILLWGFWEPLQWWPEAALYRADWSPKPVAVAYQKLIYDQWWTTANGVTNAQGEVMLDGFFGVYEVVITQGQQHSRQTVVLTRHSADPQVLVWR